jgi:hypothetical protein
VVVDDPNPLPMRRVSGLNRLRPNWTWLGGFKFAKEVVEVIVEIFRLPGVDTPKGGFCQSNAICNTFAGSMDARGDVVGGDGMVVVSLRSIPSRGRRVTMLLESIFRELDARCYHPPDQFWQSDHAI